MEPTRLLVFSGNILFDNKQNNEYVPIVFKEPVIVDEIKLVANGRPCHQKLRELSITSKEAVGPLKVYANNPTIKDIQNCYKPYMSYDGNDNISADITLTATETYPCDVLLIEGQFNILTINIYGVLYSSLLNNEYVGESIYYGSTEDNNFYENTNVIDGKLTANQIGSSNFTTITSTLVQQPPSNENCDPTIINTHEIANKIMFNYETNNEDYILDLFDPCNNSINCMSNLNNDDNNLPNEVLQEGLIKNANSINISQIYFIPLSKYNTDSYHWRCYDFYHKSQDILRNENKYKQLCNEYYYNWKPILEYISRNDKVSKIINKIKRFVDDLELILIYKYLRKKRPFSSFIASIMDRVLLWLSLEYTNAEYQTLQEYSIKIVQTIWIQVYHEEPQLLHSYLDKILSLLIPLYINPVVCYSIKSNIAKVLVVMCSIASHMDTILNHNILIIDTNVSSYRLIVEEFLKVENNCEYATTTWYPIVEKFLRMTKYYYHFKTLKQLTTKLMENLMLENDNDHLIDILGSIVELFDSLICQRNREFLMTEKNSQPGRYNLYDTNFPIGNDSTYNGAHFSRIIFAYAEQNNLLECLIAILSSILMDIGCVNFLTKSILFQIITMEYGKTYLFCNPNTLNHLSSMLLKNKNELLEHEDKPIFTSIWCDLKTLENVSWSQLIHVFLYELQVFQLCDKLEKCFENSDNFLIDDVETPDLIATFHTLIRIMLNDTLGNDAVLRAVSKPHIFRHLCTLLYTTFYKSIDNNVPLKPITASYVVYILMEFLNCNMDTFSCISQNISIIVALIKIDDNNLLKPITEWFLPVLYISDENDYLQDICNFVKNIIGDYLLNVERAKKVYTAFVLLCGHVNQHIDRELKNPYMSITNCRMKLAIKLLNIDVINVIVLFSYQLEIIATNKGYIRNEFLGKLIVGSLKYITLILNEIFPPMLTAMDYKSNFEIANFDRKFTKALICFNIYISLINGNCYLNLDSINENNTVDTEKDFRCILINYLNNHTISQEYLNNIVSNAHLCSCHHYAVRFLLKRMLSKLETLTVGLSILQYFFVSDLHTWSDDLNIIWDDIIVRYWGDFETIFNICYSSKNTNLMSCVIYLTTRITYLGPTSAQLIIKFLMKNILHDWDCSNQRQKTRLINNLQTLSTLVQCETNVIALIKYLSKLHCGSYGKDSKGNLLNLISQLVNSNNDITDTVHINFIRSRSIQFIEILCSFINPTLYENNIHKYLDSMDLDIITIFAEKLYYSLNCYSDNQFQWSRINVFILSFLFNLSGIQNSNIVIIRNVIKDTHPLMNVLDTASQYNDTVIKQYVARIVHSIYFQLDKISHNNNDLKIISAAIDSMKDIFTKDFDSLTCYQQNQLLQHIQQLPCNSELDSSNLYASFDNETECGITFNNLYSNLMQHSKPFNEIISRIYLSSENYFNMDQNDSTLINEEELELFKLNEVIKITDDMNIDTKNKIALLCSPEILIPQNFHLKITTPVISEDLSSLSIVNTNLLSMNKAITSAKTQVQMETWKKKKYTTSRLPSLHVDDFTAIVNQSIVNESSLKKSNPDK